jgi:hypothetical protein
VERNQRYKRLRRLVSRLNKERKKQRKQIDILCNDLITAQRNFIRTLETVSFTADFYESITGKVDLDSIVLTASKFIKNEIPDVQGAFFLRQYNNNFKLHMFDSDQPIALEPHRLENCFSPELVNSICKTNTICTLDDMCAMGLQGNPAELKKISAVAVPVGQAGPSLGVILLYRTCEKQLTAGELRNVVAIMPGLSRAIQSCQVPVY